MATQNILCISNTNSVGSALFLNCHLLPNKKLFFGFIIPYTNASMIGMKKKIIISHLLKFNQITPIVFTKLHYTTN